MDEKIKKLDAELSRYKEQIKRTRPGPAQEAVKARAMRVLKQKKMYVPFLRVIHSLFFLANSKFLFFPFFIFSLLQFTQLAELFRRYEGQRDMLYNQTFNLDQVSFAAEGIKDAQQTVSLLSALRCRHVDL